MWKIIRKLLTAGLIACKWWRQTANLLCQSLFANFPLLPLWQQQSEKDLKQKTPDLDINVLKNPREAKNVTVWISSSGKLRFVRGEKKIKHWIWRLSHSFIIKSLYVCWLAKCSVPGAILSYLVLITFPSISSTKAQLYYCSLIHGWYNCLNDISSVLSMLFLFCTCLVVHICNLLLSYLITCIYN